MTTSLPILDLKPIARAVSTARNAIAGCYPNLAARILDGDPTALDVGRRLQASVNELDAAFRCDVHSLQRALGLQDILDAVGVASGEHEHSDPVINARFRPARVAWLERLIARLEAEGGYDDVVSDLRADLTLLALDPD